MIQDTTDFGVRERPPQPGAHNVAFADAAGGTGADSFAMAVAQRDRKSGSVVLDVIRERRPRFVPAQVISEYAQLLRTYLVRRIEGDKFAGGFNSDEWKRWRVRSRGGPTR